MSDVFVQPEEEKVKRGSTYCLQLPKGGYRGDGARHFSDMHQERPKGNRHKLEQGKLQLEPRTGLFPVRVGQGGQVVGSPSLLSIHQGDAPEQPDLALELALPCTGVGLRTPEVPPN